MLQLQKCFTLPETPDEDVMREGQDICMLRTRDVYGARLELLALPDTSSKNLTLAPPPG